LIKREKSKKTFGKKEKSLLMVC